jgi:hypothetical protein
MFLEFNIKYLCQIYFGKNKNKIRNPVVFIQILYLNFKFNRESYPNIKQKHLNTELQLVQYQSGQIYR